MKNLSFSKIGRLSEKTILIEKIVSNDVSNMLRWKPYSIVPKKICAKKVVSKRLAY
jgi:hypothetical protein